MAEQEGRQIVRKPVEFNLSKEEDRLAWEYAKGLPNFAGAVKSGFAAMQRRRMAQQNATQHDTVPPAGQTKNPPLTGGQG